MYFGKVLGSSQIDYGNKKTRKNKTEKYETSLIQLMSTSFCQVSWL